MGAGLGGGSSDAAFTLMAINDVFELGLEKRELAAMAAELGSDCPFFIYNEPMFASGRGEILEPYPLDLTGYHIEIITPEIHISTPEAYRGVDAIKFGLGADESLSAEMLPPIDSACASRPPFPLLCSALDPSLAKRGDILAEAFSRLRNNGAAGLKERLSLDVAHWRENVVNDFEAYVFSKYPILAEIKQSLYDRGAVYASMTGSGSAMYGIFPNL